MTYHPGIDEPSNPPRRSTIAFWLLTLVALAVITGAVFFWLRAAA